MGLNVIIKGLSRENTYHGGYIRFADYRTKVAKAFNETIGEIYQKPYAYLDYKFSQDDLKQWNTILSNKNAPMNKFLWHSDCDGKFTPKECKEIYDILKNLNVEETFYDEETTMHELWLNMFRYCYKHRVNMWFY